MSIDLLACLSNARTGLVIASVRHLSSPLSVGALPDPTHNESLPHHSQEVGCHDLLFESKELRLGSDPTYRESKIKSTP